MKSKTKKKNNCKIFKEKNLKKLGFELDYKGEKEFNGEYIPNNKDYRYANGHVIVERCGKEQAIYVCSQGTTNLEYAIKTMGVHSLQDLIYLCRLVDGYKPKEEVKFNKTTYSDFEFEKWLMMNK